MINKENRRDSHNAGAPELIVRRMAEKAKTDYPELLTGGFAEIFPGMRENSALMILDFAQIPPGLPEEQNIQRFFEQSQTQGINPRLPEERQRFNNAFLEAAQRKYLIGRYAENRISMLQGSSIAAEGRTFHLGIDIFTSELETLVSPADAIVVDAGQEQGSHTYGYYVILEHSIGDRKIYSLFGHLSKHIPEIGRQVLAGEPFAQLGDFVDGENGGWSRHVHFQLLKDRPADGQIPIGYSTLEKLEENLTRFPDPNLVLRLSHV